VLQLATSLVVSTQAPLHDVYPLLHAQAFIEHCALVAHDEELTA